MEKHRTLGGGEGGGDPPGGATVGVGPLAPNGKAQSMANPLVHSAAALLADASQPELDQGAAEVAPAKATLEKAKLGRSEGAQRKGRS